MVMGQRILHWPNEHVLDVTCVHTTKPTDTLIPQGIHEVHQDS